MIYIETIFILTDSYCYYTTDSSDSSVLPKMMLGTLLPRPLQLFAHIRTAYLLGFATSSRLEDRSSNDVALRHFLRSPEMGIGLGFLADLVDCSRRLVL